MDNSVTHFSNSEVIFNMLSELPDALKTQSYLVRLNYIAKVLFGAFDENYALSYYRSWTDSDAMLAAWIQVFDQCFPCYVKTDDGRTVTMSEFLANDELLMREAKRYIELASNKSYTMFESSSPTNKYGKQIEYVFEKKLSAQEQACPYADNCPYAQSGECKGRLNRNGFNYIGAMHHIRGPVPVNIKVPKLRCTHNLPNLNLKGVDYHDLVSSLTKMTIPALAHMLSDFRSNSETSYVAIANRYGINDKLVNEIITACLTCRRFHHPPAFKDAILLNIDEFKGQKGYITVAIDAQTRMILAMVEGKTKAVIEQLTDNLDAEGTKPNVLASDANACFSNVFSQKFGANLYCVDDYFHRKYGYTKKVFIPIVRAQLVRDSKILSGKSCNKDYLFLGLAEHLEKFKESGSDITKGIIAIMRKAPNLDYILQASSEQVSEQQKAYISEHPVLSKLLILRGLIDDAFQAPTQEECHKVIDKFIELSTELKQLSPKYLKAVTTFSNAMQNKRDAIANYVRFHLTSSIIEGMNSKIKVLKRIMRGYRNPIRFMLRCMNLFNPKCPEETKKFKKSV